MSMKKRLARLAELAGMTHQGKRYFCIHYKDREGGYDVRPQGPGVPMHFDTRAELEAFEARPDVNLVILEVVYASQANLD